MDAGRGLIGQAMNWMTRCSTSSSKVCKCLRIASRCDRVVASTASIAERISSHRA